MIYALSCVILETLGCSQQGQQEQAPQTMPWTLTHRYKNLSRSFREGVGKAKAPQHSVRTNIHRKRSKISQW